MWKYQIKNKQKSRVKKNYFDSTKQFLTLANKRNSIFVKEFNLSNYNFY